MPSRQGSLRITSDSVASAMQLIRRLHLCEEIMIIVLLMSLSHTEGLQNTARTELARRESLRQLGGLATTSLISSLAPPGEVSAAAATAAKKVAPGLCHRTVRSVCR